MLPTRLMVTVAPTDGMASKSQNHNLPSQSADIGLENASPSEARDIIGLPQRALVSA